MCFDSLAGSKKRSICDYSAVMEYPVVARGIGLCLQCYTLGVSAT